ncbi:ATP-binding protein [Pseudoalteromonas maricaloris]|uniref:ATP-binding protein n=1 Tax=Pseudoalteromonas maricaloris TaxID=184924 RepID=UPI00057E6C8B|nr:ATP-binding protein [Pseudoalteromonas flavipulchra]KID33741.1 histidine kinase [Pseudoalteromonas flavipulchra NCIMB 2033 = ATCC BAA-314]MBD0782105.1 two-component sensor histidine kinase [Pseudoalteromonas flavipulchra]MBE0375820.1 two-component system, OmpR family, sensor histidine kinase QseC [Pseudoalteromonas flavipulchra NCIMB 2033 = ATCC BAA-314]
MGTKSSLGGASITRKLTLILVSALVLTASMALLRGYHSSMAMAQAQLDSHLESIATLVNTQVTATTLPSGAGNNAFYFLVLEHNQVVAGSELLARYKNKLKYHAGFSTQNVGATRLRTFSEAFGERQILVAEPVQKRFALAEGMIVSAMTPLVVIMPFLAVFIAWIIYTALKPLRDLSKELRRRNPKDFTQLAVQSDKAEVAIVIATLNDLFQKVEVAYLKERYFASDAAHELKTPIASLKIHLHNLTHDTKHPSATAMSKGLEQLNHVVEQMLTLARTEPELWHKQFAQQDLVALTQDLIANCYPRIEQKSQNISLEASEATLEGCEFTLTTLFSNLIGNAIKYTPIEGDIEVKIQQHAQRVVWQIDDSGCGMSDAEIERIFDRFYRVGGDKHPSGEKGAGLGMAIVNHIIAIYHADISFARSHLGGLRVCVNLPRGLDAKD